MEDEQFLTTLFPFFSGGPNNFKERKFKFVTESSTKRDLSLVVLDKSTLEH